MHMNALNAWIFCINRINVTKLHNRQEGKDQELLTDKFINHIKYELASVKTTTK